MFARRLDETQVHLHHNKSIVGVSPAPSKFIFQKETPIFKMANSFDRFGGLAALSQIPKNYVHLSSTSRHRISRRRARSGCNYLSKGNTHGSKTSPPRCQFERTAAIRTYQKIRPALRPLRQTSQTSSCSHSHEAASQKEKVEVIVRPALPGGPLQQHYVLA